MTAIEQLPAGARALKMRVDGIHCSASAIKVENALKRLPGVSNVIAVDEDRAPHNAIEDKIRRLDYTPRPSADSGQPAATESDEGEVDRSLWQTRKGQMVAARVRVWLGPS